MKICNKCGVEKELDQFHTAPRMKDGHRNDCIECRKAYHSQNSKKYYELHKAEKLQKVKAYAESNVDKVKEYQQVYRKRPEALQKEKLRKRIMRSNPANKARLSKRSLQYYYEKKNAPGFTTKEELEVIWQAYDNKCYICGAEATETDHVRPLSKGGSDWPDNLRPCCKPCNVRKGNHWPYIPQTIETLSATLSSIT